MRCGAPLIVLTSAWTELMPRLPSSLHRSVSSPSSPPVLKPGPLTLKLAHAVWYIVVSLVSFPVLTASIFFNKSEYS